MEANVLVTSLASGTLGAALLAITNWVIKSRNDTVEYDRKREVRLEDRVGKLEQKIEEKERENDELVKKNLKLESQVREIMYKISAILHKITNIEGYESIRKEVEELEREFKRENNIK